MNILIIGSGGREHALAWKIRQSPLCEKLYIAPGNAGTAQEGENVSLALSDHTAVIDFCTAHSVGLVVVAPDNQLAEGMVDSLESSGIRAFGPTKAAAKLEWSKAFAKDFMRRHNIPTAQSEIFTDAARAQEYAQSLPLPVVIKADGLALGKGVVIAQTHEEAQKTITAFMSGEAFGESGTTVVIEEFLTGREVSAHALSDGDHALLFPLAKDHKRIGEGDTGPNTGGMGTIVPVGVDAQTMKEITERIVLPVLRGMKEEGAAFRGLLFPGLMLTADGPKVIEFNARFGDPETESYMRLLASDIVPLLEACIDGNLSESTAAWAQGAAATVMLASGGYPGAYEKGKEIRGIDAAEALPDIAVFHAGTSRTDQILTTAGGRVLGISARGNNLADALANAYAAAEKISFDGMQYRRDIGASERG